MECVEKWLEGFANINTLYLEVDNVRIDNGQLGRLCGKAKWFDKMIHETSSNMSLVRNNNASVRVDKTCVGILLEPASCYISYYDFVNDDKYFIVNNRGEAFIDNSAYLSFYESLPKITELKVMMELDCEGNILHMTRRQYGHCMFDEVLPTIVGEKLVKNRGIRCGALGLYSKEWQVILAEDMRAQFHDGDIIKWHKLPSRTGLIRLISPIIFLPIYPDIWYYWAQRMNGPVVDEKDDHRRYDLCILSRSGFGQEERVKNKDSLYRRIAKKYRTRVILPHTKTYSDVMREIRSAKHVICEPGSTPLIAMSMAKDLNDIMVMQSSRTIKDCRLEYFYSGWRYHQAFSDRIRYYWGRPEKSYNNPFSDVCLYPEGLLVI